MNYVGIQTVLQELPKVESIGIVAVSILGLNLPVNTKEMSIDEAKKTGTIAMFGEKYGDVVRVIGMGDVSLEFFCGGTHVSNTGQIGPVKIISEGSIASGVRRVEMYAGPKAWEYISQNLKVLNSASSLLKAKPLDLFAQIERMQDQLKAKEKQVAAMEEKLALANSGALLNKAQKIGDVEVIAEAVEDISSDGLKSLAENLRKVRGSVVVALAAKLAEDKVSIVVAVSDDLVKRFNSGTLVKEAATICGGSGGGRPQVAQAGGKDPSKIKQALASIVESIKKRTDQIYVDTDRGIASAECALAREHSARHRYNQARVLGCSEWRCCSLKIALRPFLAARYFRFSTSLGSKLRTISQPLIHHQIA